MSVISFLENLFYLKKDYDVTFVIQNQELLAHQLVLCNRSSVFKAMIKGPMAPSNQRHEISDPAITFNDFNNFLKFLYIDNCEINAENIEVLLHLSHMYDVPYLFETCVNQLPTLLKQQTLFKFVELGILYDNKADMVFKCLAKVPDLIKELKYMKGEEYIWISSKLAVEFVKNCPRTPTFTEDAIFNMAFDWAKGIRSPRNIQTIMAPLIPHICFPKLNKKSLTTTVYKHEIIPADQLLKIIIEVVLAEPQVPVQRAFQPTPFVQDAFRPSSFRFG